MREMYRGSWTRRGLVAVCAAVVAMTAAVLDVPTAAATATSGPTTVTLNPVADTYVAADNPAANYGSSTHMTVDASPVKQAFLRFNVTGVTGRAVTGVRLRLYQIDAAATGGRVFAMTSNSWVERLTWSTKPAIDGAQLATFGKVAANQWYEVPLGAIVRADGLVSIALDSTSADGAKWATRESTTKPQLLVDLAPPPSDDGLAVVAGSTAGSSDPTFYGSEHHMAVTAAGRVYAVHGRHATGLQVAWHDPGTSAWSAVTRGAVTDGLVLSGTGTGDWPASIAIARGADGRDHAWVVWGGTAAWGETPRPVQMRHLTDLDAPGGPTVGPVVDVAAPGVAGNGRVDIGVERLAGGGLRGHLVFVRRLSTADSSSEMVTQSFTGVESDAPALGRPTALFSAGGQRVATFAGSALVVRRVSGRLALYRHDPAVADGGWTAGAEGEAISASARVVAATLASGEVLGVAESDTTNHVVIAQRFGADGTPRPVELRLTGYREPTVAATADGAVLVAIRVADGALVSRTLSAGAGWSTDDRVELATEGGGNYQWPNALRDATIGTLRFVVRGPSGAKDCSAVLAVTRTL